MNVYRLGLTSAVVMDLIEVYGRLRTIGHSATLDRIALPYNSCMRINSGILNSRRPEAAGAVVSKRPAPLRFIVRWPPFWGTMERVALWPGAFGKPRRRTFESS